MRHIAPKYILMAGCTLAAAASFVNVFFLLQTGASVSHLSGDLARLAADLISGEEAYRKQFALVLLATLGFVCGAVASGYLMHHPVLELERPYGRLLAGIGLVFLAAFAAEQHIPALAVCLGGLGCGMQNAMATKYRGVILRTTHVTGLLTDFGATVGMKLRGHMVERWKIEVPLFLSIAYFLGAMIGSLLFFHTNLKGLLIAGLAYLVGGLSWAVFRIRVIMRRAQRIKAVSSETRMQP